MEILEFRKIRLTDRHDKKYDAWSRIYEYPLILDMLEKYLETDNIVVHNTSWGHKGCHITFKDDLENKYKEVVNSDILKSNVPNTIIQDITKEPTSDFINRFDVVMNVSTVEEVRFDHVMIFNNLYKQMLPRIHIFNHTTFQSSDNSIFLSDRGRQR